ncbi:hypothetical protein D3C74_404420 [compost metagenome]
MPFTHKKLTVTLHQLLKLSGINLLEAGASFMMHQTIAGNQQLETLQPGAIAVVIILVMAR